MEFWWPRLAQLGGGFWIAAIGAMISGFLIARHLLRPGAEGRGSERAQRIGLWRTVAGFGFVLGVSWSYRAPEDTLNNALGTFNMTMGVAVVVALVALAFLRLSGPLPEASDVLSRMAGAAVGFGVLLGMGIFIGQVNDYTPRPLVIAMMGAFFGAVVFYGAACWYISRFWFGLNGVHPLLGSFVTAVTICVMTVYTLVEEGPKSLPTSSWLLITLCGWATTIGICAWDLAENRRPGSRTMAGAIATVVVVLVGGGGVFIAGGTAERALCDGKTAVNCDHSNDDQPSRIRPQAAEFQLPVNMGLELNAERPTATVDPVAADLIFDGAVRSGDRSSVVAWPGPDEPDRDRCDQVIRARFRAEAGYRPAAGGWFCVATTQGRLAGVQVLEVDDGGLTGRATLWL